MASSAAEATVKVNLASAAASVEYLTRDLEDIDTGMDIDPPSQNKPRRAVEQRRLDQLAWLLEGNSICAAVAEVNGVFYIATNKFFRDTLSHGEQLDYVNVIMHYFWMFANDLILDITTEKGGKGKKKEEVIREYRNAIIKLICKQQIKAARGAIRIPDSIIETVVQNISISTLVDWARVLKTNKKAIGGKKEAFYMAIAFVSIIFNRVRKIENAIINSGQHFAPMWVASTLLSSIMNIGRDTTNERANKENKITNGQLLAFKGLNFSSHNSSTKSGIPIASNILLLEKEAGVHAELQILSQILELERNGMLVKGKEVYIGISKRCCLECHRMLESAHKVLFSARGISIKFGGAHDASFIKNWVVPSIFSESERDQLPLAHKVWEEYSNICDTDRRKATTGEYEQGHSMSNSSFSFTPEEQLRRYREELEDDLEVFMRRGQGHLDAARMLTLGLKLCEIIDFQDLFNESEEEEAKEDIARIKLLAIIDQLSEKGEQIGPDVLLRLVQNPNFMDKTIVKFFSGVRVLNQEHGAQLSLGKLTVMPS